MTSRDLWMEGSSCYLCREINGKGMKYMKRKKTKGRMDLYGKRARNREDGCGETFVIGLQSHSRRPDGGKGGGIRNLYCYRPILYIDTWTTDIRSPLTDTQPAQMSYLSLPAPFPHPTSYGLFLAQENRNILYQLSITYIPFLI